MPKRSALQRERDLAITEELHLRGRNTVEIADELKRRTGSDITSKQVLYDIRVLRKNYRNSANRDYSLELSQQLRRIDMLERRAWELLETSGQDRKTTSRKTRRKAGADGDISQSEIGDRTEARDPDARYMIVIQWCIAERNKLLGLYPPEELRHTGTVGAIREIVYELPPQKQAAPGLTVIGGRQLPQGMPSAPEPVEAEHLDEKGLVEIWGAPGEIVIEANGKR